VPCVPDRASSPHARCVRHKFVTQFQSSPSPSPSPSPFLSLSHSLSPSLIIFASSISFSCTTSLTSVTYLDISYNAISMLPPEIGERPIGFTLSFPYLPAVLPYSILFLLSFKSLAHCLSFCPSLTGSRLMCTVHLLYLTYFVCRFRENANAGRELVNLSHLDASHNRLQCLGDEAMRHLSSLSSISFASNTSLSPLYHFCPPSLFPLISSMDVTPL
jgi:Leucine-rich repeat (LRR) protein